MSVNNTQRALLANYLLGQGSSSTQGKNYVKNSIAINGTDNVTASGGTVLKNTTTPLTGISDFAITLGNNTTDYIEWSLDSLDRSLTNQNCQLTFDYKITSIGSVVQGQVYIGGNLAVSQTIPSTPTTSTFSINVPCGDLSGSTTVRISNATGNSGASVLNVANVNYGKATNIGTVSQARLIDTITVTGCAAGWSTTSTSFATLGTQTGCTYASSKGICTGPNGTNSSQTASAQIKCSSIPSGDYRIEYEGAIEQLTAGVGALFQFSDGTNTAREISNLSSNSSGIQSTGISQTITYTAPQSNITFDLKAKVIGAGTAKAYGTTTQPGVFKIWQFPSASQQAVTPAQQRPPTITRLTSGSGTYTTPTGAVYLKITAVGGGGGGGAQSGAGGSGGTTTFGISLITAFGGSGGAAGRNGGFGGANFVNSPAIAIISLPGAGGGAGSVNGTNDTGGHGGVSPLGGAGGSMSTGGTSVLNAVSNTGSGGGGQSAGGGGGGGGAGAYIQAIILNPSSSYSYQVGTSGTAGPSAGAGGSGVIIVEEFYSQSAPILVGSVTSNSSGAERIERVQLSCTASSSITRQSGSWFSSIGNISSGICSYTLASGTFSDIPTCTISGNNTSTSTAEWKVQPSTATTGSIFCTSGGAACSGGNAVNVICMGPR